MNKLSLAIVLGTTREGRKSLNAANYVNKIAEALDKFDIKFVDVKDFFPLPGEGNDKGSKNPDWVEINKWADAYVIVAPEYNHSFPGSLKMLLDNDLGNYTHKPVTIAAVSAGQFGGARMIENLLSPLRELGFVVSHRDINFTNVQEIFNESGELNEEYQYMNEIVEKALKELKWLAEVLSWGRENVD